MSRKKRRGSRVKIPKRQKKREKFNPVFSSLKSLLKQVSVPPIERPCPPANKYDSDRAIFIRAMQDVVPLGNSDKNRVLKEPDTRVRPVHRANSDELEAMAYLNDLVTGSVDMDITFRDDYIEGHVRGFDPNLMKKLKKGMFPVQDYIDLHGLTRQEAEDTVKNFLLKSHSLGLRCVLIIHGRGLNSENNIPVLKKLLPLWLNRKPIKNLVLAFSTAMPYDGGTGTIYVLLRKIRG